MTVDAALTVLGPARVQRWTLDSDSAFERAREREASLVQQLEAALSRQLRVETHLAGPLVDREHLQDEAGEDDAVPDLLPIGDADGLRWFQDTVRETLLVLSNSGAPGSRSVTEFAPRLRHLLEHDAASGLFLPVEFPEPFEVRHEDDIVSVGSLVELADALRCWNEVLASWSEITGRSLAPGLIAYTQNLTTMVEIALRRRLALELL